MVAYKLGFIHTILDGLYAVFRLAVFPSRFHILLPFLILVTSIIATLIDLKGLIIVVSRLRASIWSLSAWAAHM
jgi:hypothetical protein